MKRAILLVILMSSLIAKNVISQAVTTVAVTGSSITGVYTNWSNTQLDNFSTGENYEEIYVVSDGWNDLSGGQLYKSIIEYGGVVTK